MTKNPVALNHCLNAGHHIASIVFAQVIDPATRVLVPTDVRVMCIKCGLTLDEIRESKPARTPRKKKDSPEDFSTLDK